MDVATYLVGAGVAFQPSGQCNCTGQEEDVVQDVQRDHDDGVDCPVKVDRGRDEVEQRYNRECGSEHAVVDRGGVACKRHGDDVTNQGHDEHGEDELYIARLLAIRPASLLKDVVAVDGSLHVPPILSGRAEFL